MSITNKLNHPNIVSSEQWLNAREALLVKEKAFNKLRDELTQERQALPWTKVNKNYVFEGENGDISLSELFEGCSQLIVYHFMYHPSWDEGCVSCSFWADNFDGIVVHLNARDVSLVAISRAPIDKLLSYKKRLNWSFNWVSSQHNEFGQDFDVSFDRPENDNSDVTYNYRQQQFPGQEAPGVSVFVKDEQGNIYHSYSTYSRGLDMLNGAYHYLDIVPKGRDEKELPWSMAWLARHDAYE